MGKREGARLAAPAHTLTVDLRGFSQYGDRHATPTRRRQMRVARSHVRLCARAQTGVAPNAIELHPILGFRCLTG
jgi:hypothetical protein